MHVVFVNYADFQGPSGIHIFQLANALADLGVSSTAVVPNRPESVEIFGEPKFEVASFSEANKCLNDLKPNIIHSWTPRESTRWMTERLNRNLNIPYVVHLEDNEERILSSYFDVSFFPLRLWRRLRLSLDVKNKPLPHPKRYNQFIAVASGATMIIDTLQKCIPRHLPTKVIWPACEEHIFSMPLEPNAAVRDRMGISREAIVVTYPGNVHNDNVEDVEGLYQAVRMLKDKGEKIVLVRIGRNFVPFANDISDMEEDCLFELGELPPRDIPQYVEAADILVQPGHDNSFNRYRFPSKLPMFLASGRPVILGNVNIAKYLTDGEDAVVLTESTSVEIADVIERLVRNPIERNAIGTAGRKFAGQQFSWKRTAERVLDFYEWVLRKAG